MPFRLALPPDLAADLFADAFARQGVDVVRADDPAATLAAEEADVALVPTFSVLRDAASFDVLPVLAFSTWEMPFARLFLKGDLASAPQSVAFDPRQAQAILLARLVLREHYGFAPTFAPEPAPSLASLGRSDAVLLVGRDVPLLDGPGLTLDLGQEFYELASYPMVWGLFVTRKESATKDHGRALRRVARDLDGRLPLWVQARDMPETLHHFFAEALRFRFDDLAIASLTELRELFFELGVLDEVPDVPVVEFDDEEDEGQEPTPLL